MHEYKPSEVALLQRYVDFFRSIPELQSLTAFGWNAAAPADSGERGAFRSLRAKGILEFERRVDESTQPPTITDEYASLSTAGADEVVRLFREGILKSNDL